MTGSSSGRSVSFVSSGVVTLSTASLASRGMPSVEASGIADNKNSGIAKDVFVSPESLAMHSIEADSRETSMMPFSRCSGVAI